MTRFLTPSRTSGLQKPLPNEQLALITLIFADICRPNYHFQCVCFCKFTKFVLLNNELSNWYKVWRLVENWQTLQIWRDLALIIWSKSFRQSNRRDRASGCRDSDCKWQTTKMKLNDVHPTAWNMQMIHTKFPKKPPWSSRTSTFRGLWREIAIRSIGLKIPSNLYSRLPTVL